MLADLDRQAAKLAEDRRQLEAQLIAEQAAAALTQEGAFAYGHFANLVIERRHGLEQASAEVAGHIERAREVLRDTFAELKKFELAAAAAEERERQAAELRDRVAQDEIGLNIFRRRAE